MLRKYFRDESGNIESAMVLIPLLFLFLCSMQLVSTIYLRNMDQSEVQSQASTRAISGRFNRTDKVLKISSNFPFEDRELLIVSKRRSIPLLIPSLGSALNGSLLTQTTGVAVIEP